MILAVELLLSKLPSELLKVAAVVKLQNILQLRKKSKKVTGGLP